MNPIHIAIYIVTIIVTILFVSLCAIMINTQPGGRIGETRESSIPLWFKLILGIFSVYFITMPYGHAQWLFTMI